jgi:hypothetical protein
MRALWVILAIGCSSSTAAPPDKKPARRWIPGDVHMHVAPPDNDVDLSVAGVAKAARAASMEWVVLTPHLWGSVRGARYDAAWREMAKQARATKGLTLIPGIEWTTPDGHFTVAGVDVPSLGRDLLASAKDHGAFVSVNHPFAVPTRIPGVSASHYDLSYRAWSEGKGAVAPIGGVEVWNVPLGFANVISRPGGKSGEARAWIAADQLARTKRQRVSAVGGTDNHKQAVMATTWVLAESASETEVLEALRTGATCVGGPEAGSLEARGNGGWVSIGGIVTGPSVELRWSGTAQLFIDGVDQGEKTGRHVHATGGVPHTYRIVVGASRCGFIYANL